MSSGLTYLYESEAKICDARKHITFPNTKQVFYSAFRFGWLKTWPILGLNRPKITCEVNFEYGDEAGMPVGL